MAIDLAARLNEWRTQLLDTSKRNRLVSCKFSRGGAIAIEHPALPPFWESFVVSRTAHTFQRTEPLLSALDTSDAPDEQVDPAEPARLAAPERNALTAGQLAACRASDALDQLAVLTQATDAALDGRLKRLALAAGASLSEQGVNSLFVACGFLTWFESPDSDEAIRSPLVLAPATLARETADAAWRLSPLDDELVPNHALAEILRTSFRIALPPLDADAIDESSVAMLAFLDAVRGVVPERWSVEPTVALGTFAFQKIAMWHDLRDHEAAIVDNPICRGMAGDNSAMPVSAAAAIEPGELDRAVPLESHHLIVDCDSSQLAAIQAVKEGRNLILDGPPGTGKSQTIANVIAECLAASKTVLFVSEKAAALEVVKRRLDQAGIGDFCLELHSHKANKKQVIDDLGATLHRRAERYRSLDRELADLRLSRDRLNEYVRALHARQSKLDATPFDVHGSLAAIRTTAATRTEIADPLAIDATALQAMCEAAGRLANCRAIVASGGAHPWCGLRATLYSLNLPEDIRFHFARAADGLGARLRAAAALMPLGFLGASPTLADLDAARLAGEAALTFPLVPQAWVDAGLAATATRYLALQRDAAGYPILLSGLAAYRGDAVDRADADAFARVAETKAADAMLAAPRPGVRARQDALRAAGEAMASLASSVNELRVAVVALCAAATLPALAEFTLAEAETLASHAATLATLTTAKGAWFDTTTRDRLRRTVTTARQVGALATATRDALGGRLLPAAFANVAAPQAEAVVNAGAWWRRWGSAWRRARQAFATLYEATPPASARLLIDDAYQLKRYHDLRRQLTATIGLDADAIGWNGEVEFSWDAVVAPLERIAALPADLQATAIAPADGPRLAARAADVARAAATARERVDRAGGVVSVTRACGAADLLRASVAETVVQASDAAERFARAAATLTPVVALIEPARDVDAATLRDDVAVLLEARSLRARAAEIAGTIGEKIDPSETRRICDVEAKAKLAAWVSAFVKQHAGVPPAPLVRVMSDAATRAALGDALDAMRAADDAASAESLRFARSLFDAAELARSGVDVARAPAADIVRWLGERVRDADRVSEWVGFVNVGATMERLGLSTLRAEVLSGAVPVEQGVDVLRQRFYRRWLDAAYAGEPALRDFDANGHAQDVDRFRALDRFWIQNGFARVREHVLAGTPRVGGLHADAPGNSEVGILLREANKKKRHLPIRKLFAAMPTLLSKLKPCVMMSPLSVSTYFESQDVRFDVVVFDEASQVRPHDAVCAIYRGAQLVIAGDQKQLPPSNFFERLGADVAESADDEEPGDGETRDFESILDVCASLRLPRQRLKWHYRSRRESLIAFSNRHFYDGELITFPSVRDVEGSSGVEFAFVEDGRWQGGTGGGVNAAEAVAIAIAAIEHAQQTPHVSLGIITMNVPQQVRVLDEINARRKGKPDLDAFFATDRSEPFFVKNLENVQGDERDVIFLGVGYAKTASGTLSHNFGPLNRQGGERRLNVAVTRARARLRLFSSIVADDVDLSRTNARGAKLLRAYLDFARRGPAALGAEVTADGEHDFDSDFERAVADALIARGLDVRRQIGCSGYRIDLAAVDPKRAGRYVLGIECDGATYHSSATARDRDRLRQDVLEGLGWRMCRIWSTDWIRDPRRQIERVLAAYEAALGAAAADDVPPPRGRVAPDGRGSPDAPAVAGPPPLAFETIDDVDDASIQRTLVDCVAHCGLTRPDDLLKHACRQLGFRRLGSQIRERLQDELDRLVARNVLARGDDDRLKLGLVPLATPSAR